MRRHLSLAVVGADHPNRRGPSRRFEIKMCLPGEVVILSPEPNNKADENAIAVYSVRGIMIGYVTAERAPMISKYVRNAAAKAIFQSENAWGATIRVSLDGKPPSLPTASPIHPGGTQSLSEDVPDFYPDPEYDD